MTNDTAEKPLSMRKLTELIAEGVSALVDDRNSAKADKATAKEPQPYTEADALRRCINALQDLKSVENRGRNSSYSPVNGMSMMDYSPSWAAGDRILRFLAARFDVSLIEVKRPDCNRAHLDSVRPDQLIDALRVAVQS